MIHVRNEHQDKFNTVSASKFSVPNQHRYCLSCEQKTTRNVRDLTNGVYFPNTNFFTRYTSVVIRTNFPTYNRRFSLLSRFTPSLSLSAPSSVLPTPTLNGSGSLPKGIKHCIHPLMFQVQKLPAYCEKRVKTGYNASVGHGLCYLAGGI